MRTTYKPIRFFACLLLAAILFPAKGIMEPVIEIDGLEYLSTMELKYAEQFQVDYFEGGYKLLSISDGAKYLIVPEDENEPAHVDPDIVVLHQPLDHIYLAATSAMALFDAMDALEAITLSGTRSTGWYVENAVAAMDAGKIQFAGKYNEPDYELLVNEGCDLAIESTMILHSPKVKEMLELLGIPVFVERSSYESHPLGRTEWIKVYGAMLNLESQAQSFFDQQAALVDELKGAEHTQKTVAFFYVSSDGTIVVRSPSDYVSKMIELAGGRYIFDNLEDFQSERSSISLSVEEFYDTAVNADYLIYNSSVDDELKTMEELLAKNTIFSDFKAVQEGNVWCTGKYLYQATDIVGMFIQDVHGMLIGDDTHMTFLYKLI